MKKQDLLLSMNLIDDKYIAEASPAEAKKRTKIKTFILIAACLTVFTALSLFLFIPYSTVLPSVSSYSDSDYYNIIEKLNEYYYEPSEYKNNFESIIGGLTSIFYAVSDGATKDAKDEIAIEESAANGAFTDPGDADVKSAYEEVTDNQVEGVVEGDLFKRSDKYIYYLDGNILRVYSIEGTDSAEVGNFSMENLKEYRENTGNDMLYLSEDCTTVTVILNYYNRESGLKNTFSVISLDVTDPHNIIQKHKVDYYGSFVSARLVDGNIYLVSKFITSEPEDYKEIKEYVPYVVTEEGESVVSADCIYAPDVLSSDGYTVLTKLDEKTLELKADYALLSFNDPIIYATAESFYFARNYTEKTEEGIYTVYADMTEICRIDYSGEGFAYLGSVTLEGTVNDQYSLDEYNGILRVFTSTDLSKSWQTANGLYGLSTEDTGVNANLYCIDIKTLEVVSSVEKFAPKGENVKSARFDGDTAYVCTSVQLTDPVFFFDLSDIDRITYKETGTIEGFSTSLVDFGDGYLLGIGRKDWSTPKIEVYKEEADKVVSVCAIEMPEATISEVYKSYYIDRERGYIGIGVSSYNYSSNEYGTRYVIFKFENENLSVAYELECECETYRMRGTYIDEYIYILSGGELNVIHESQLK